MLKEMHITQYQGKGASTFKMSRHIHVVVATFKRESLGYADCAKLGHHHTHHIKPQSIHLLDQDLSIAFP